MAIEFAMMGPILIVLLLGIVCYGGDFWIAHSVQQPANDGDAHQPDSRLALLDHLERLTFEAPELLATHLLESGWRPQASSSEPTSEAA